MYKKLGCAFFAATLILIPRYALADGDAGPTIESCREAYEEAARREKDGDLEAALQQVVDALAVKTLDGPNPVLKDAQTLARRVAATMNKKEKSPYALEIAMKRYEAIYDFGNADEALMQMHKAKAKPAEDAFKTLIDHALFFKRERKALHEREYPPGDGAFMQANAGNPFNYTADKAVVKTLADAVAAKASALMAEEEKAVSKKEISQFDVLNGAATLKEAARLNGLLISDDAIDAFGDNAAARQTAKALSVRAEKRGDILAPSEQHPAFLEAAAGYYAISRSEAKIRQVRAKAEKLGDAMNAKKDYVTAAAYFRVAQKEKKASEADQKFAAHQKAAAQEAAKENQSADPKKLREDVKKMRKDDAEKKKFKKEQDDLEKELGF